MKRVVLYHGDGCPDGFTAAWVAWLRFGDGATYLPVRYQEPPPEEAWLADELFVLDFSYPRSTMEALAERVFMIVVLDHHKTAEAELAGWAPKGSGRVVFDMERSGAKLAWDELSDDGTRGLTFPPTDRFQQGHRWSPKWLVDYVEDRDLWRFALPDSRKVAAALRAEPMTFDAWSFFAQCGLDRAMRDGDVVLSYDQRTIERMQTRAREGEIGGHKISVVNATHLHSELLEGLAAGKPFAASWWQREDGLFQYSLRSGPDGLDVSAIAKGYGGGGHMHAAGFSSGRIVHGTDFGRCSACGCKNCYRPPDA
jgi:oligoribonuclease NrnB/cAMP/cGMP phosphodiesterase (DHH superfamily)